MEQKYGDHTITLTEDMRFEVKGPLYDAEEYRGTRIFDTYREATEKIEARIKASEKQAKAKLSIQVLDDNGKAVTITGVHGRNYHLLGVGDTTMVYPPEPWIALLINEHAKITARAKEISDTLDKYGFRARPYGYRNMTFERAMETILSSLDRAASDARDHNPAKDAAL